MTPPFSYGAADNSALSQKASAAMLRQMIRNLILLSISLEVAWLLFQAFLTTKLPHQ